MTKRNPYLAHDCRTDGHAYPSPAHAQAHICLECGYDRRAAARCPVQDGTPHGTPARTPGRPCDAHRCCDTNPDTGGVKTERCPNIAVVKLVHDDPLRSRYYWQQCEHHARQTRASY